MVTNKQRQVYHIIWEQGPITKAGIQSKTHLKITTLSRMLEDLIDSGLIMEIGTAESTGGRRPFVYGIVPDKYYIIGIDLSRTYTRVALMDLKSTIKIAKEFKMDVHCNPDLTFSRVSLIIQELAAGNDILGIYIGSVGPIDRMRGIVMSPRNFLSDGWDNVNIVDRLEVLTGLKVYLESGSNCAALAEYHYGSVKVSRSMGYIHIGMGVRSGVLQEGTLIRTAGDRDDLLGHMTIQMTGDRCYCGNFGCLETYCSIGAMVDRYIGKLKAGRKSILQNKADYDSITHEELFWAAIQKDELALEVIQDAAVALGNGISNFCNLLGLDHLILSGPVIEYSELFYQESVRIAAKKLLLPTQFERSTLYPYAIVKGAGIMAVQKFLMEGLLLE